MLQSIIEYLRIKVQALNIGDVFGLGELVYDARNGNEAPAFYNGSGQYVSLVDFDNHAGLIYFRLLNVTNTTAESMVGGDDSIQRAYTVRIVAFVNKSVYNTDNNYVDDKIAHNIQLAINSEDDNILSVSIFAEAVSILTQSYDTNRRNVLAGEGLDTTVVNIPFEYAFLSLDFSVTVTGSVECFEVYGCNDTPVDYLELLREAICPTECADVTITDTDTPPNLLFTVESGNTQAIPSSDISLVDTDGDLLDAITVLATQDGTLEAPDATAQLNDSAGIPISTTLIKSGETKPVTAPDGTVNARNSVPTVIATGTVKSGGTSNLAIPDTRINKSDGTQIALTPSTVAYSVGNSLITLNNSDGDLIETRAVLATDPATFVAPVALVNVSDQNGTLLGQVSGVSNKTVARTVTVNYPVCPTLVDQLTATSTSGIVTALETTGQACSVQAALVNRYGEGCLIGKPIGTTFTSPSGLFWHGDKIYICTGSTNILIYDAITKVQLSSITGFTSTSRSAVNNTSIAVSQISANTVRVMSTASPSTQLIVISTITQPVGIAINAANTVLYVGSLNNGQLQKYNPVTGMTIGSLITGFQSRIDQITFNAGETEYWVMTGNAGSTQRIRRMSVATDTLVSEITLLSVAAAGLARSFSIRDNGNVIVIYDGFLAIEYTDAGVEVRRTFTGGFNCGGGFVRNVSETCEAHWAAAQSLGQITQWICG